MASIDRKEVKIGTVLHSQNALARVERLTATQAACVFLNDNLEPRTGTEFKVKLDVPNSWGGIRAGGLQIGTGGGWHSKYWYVTENVESLLAAKRQQEANARAEIERREQAERERVSAQFQSISEAYEKRQCVSSELGIWSLAFDYQDRPVAVVWSTQPYSLTDWNTGRHQDGVRLNYSFYMKDSRNETARYQGTIEALTELEALASLRYDRAW